MNVRSRWLVCAVAVVLVFVFGSRHVSGQGFPGIQSFSNASLIGKYAFHYAGPTPSFLFLRPTLAPSGGSGTFTADGLGNITSGAAFHFHQDVEEFDLSNMRVVQAGAVGPCQLGGGVCNSVQYRYFLNFQNIGPAPLTVGMVVIISGFSNPRFDGPFILTAFDANTFTVSNPNAPGEIDTLPLPGAGIAGYLVRDRSCDYTFAGTYAVNSDGTATINLQQINGPCLNGSLTLKANLGLLGASGEFYTTPTPSDPPGITFSSFFTGSFIKQTLR